MLSRKIKAEQSRQRKEDSRVKAGRTSPAVKPSPAKPELPELPELPSLEETHRQTSLKHCASEKALLEHLRNLGFPADELPAHAAQITSSAGHIRCFGFRVFFARAGGGTPGAAGAAGTGLPHFFEVYGARREPQRAYFSSAIRPRAANLQNVCKSEGGTRLTSVREGNEE